MEESSYPVARPAVSGERAEGRQLITFVLLLPSPFSANPDFVRTPLDSLAYANERGQVEINYGVMIARRASVDF